MKYVIYDYNLHLIKVLNNITAIANTPILDEDLQFQFNGSLRIKISKLTAQSGLKVIESDGFNTHTYDYNDGDVFSNAIEFELTVNGNYRYNIMLTNNTTIESLHIFYRRE